MSANDAYDIKERPDGLFNIYHYDVDAVYEDDPGQLILNGCDLKTATRYCDDHPAEYGYHIGWLELED